MHRKNLSDVVIFTFSRNFAENNYAKIIIAKPTDATINIAKFSHSPFPHKKTMLFPQLSQ